MSTRISITGGAGFIGTHLAERLCRQCDVVLVDNLRRNSLELVPSLSAEPRVSFVQCDVLDRASVAEALAGSDCIVHMAAIAGVSSYYEQPLRTLRTNLIGTINVLDSAIANGSSKFVFVSTSEVFGSNALAVSEESPFIVEKSGADKRWVYAISKLAAEQFVRRYAEQHGLDVTILRPFNVYGPRQTGEGAIGNFARAAIRGQPVTVYGPGSALRAWCYVSDFVDCVITSLSRPEASGQDFNIGNPATTVSTLQLAETFARLVPGLRVEHKDVHRVDVESRSPVIDKARRLLGFEPKVGLEEGLMQTLDWFRSQGDA